MVFFSSAFSIFPRSPLSQIGEKLCLQELVGDRPHLVRGCSTRDKDGLVSSFELLADLLLPEI